MNTAAVLDYAGRYSRQLKPFSDVNRRIAATLGAIPLVVGVLIFLAWAITRAQALIGFGVINIFLGLLLFGSGCLFLLGHVISNWEHLTIGDDRFRRWAHVCLTLLLLLSNFPICWFIILAVGYLSPHLGGD